MFEDSMDELVGRSADPERLQDELLEPGWRAGRLVAGFKVCPAWEDSATRSRI